MMRNIKVVGIILLVQLCFSACSKNLEENEIQDQDPIIGTWHLFSEEGIELTLCEQKGTVTYGEDSIYTLNLYQLVDGECISDGEIDLGTWSNKGNGEYEIKTKVLDIESTSIQKIIFSDDFNSFTAEEENGYTYVVKRK
ncbi:lipocalin family protein [Tenacibaculum amylolyticum]|uniref:lipocalin family protein n=1 Tax=Tenacibaculum amylolyticum TaxID=104269 RepID=UPI003893F320